MSALPCLIVVNAGSSSLKFALYDAKAQQRIAWGQTDGLLGHPRVSLRSPFGDIDHALPRGYAMPQAIASLADWLQTHRKQLKPLAVGHRVVHGGMEFHAPVRLTPDIINELETLDPLAPLHQPYILEAIRALGACLPELPQFACFDTAFHRQWPAVARRFAIPRAWHRAGIRRYGFHGLSYAHVSRKLAEIDPQASRVVIAHLGSGASVCAIRNGVSLDCTLGFTALDGLPMSTRCGALDPGVVLHLIRHHKLSAPEVERVLYQESGLLGVSQISGDMRELLASDAPKAREAIDLFVYRCIQAIAGMTGVLGGIDALVFTGGIGENAAPIRQRILAGLSYLGLTLAAQPMAKPDGVHRLSPPRSRVRCWVIPTNEEHEIALETLKALG
jgi:acetate kinase